MGSSPLLDETGHQVEYDPVFLHARREAIIIFSVWVLALLWAVPYCYLNGYTSDFDVQIDTMLGVPSWVLWGVAVPWLLADIFTVWFCFCYMADDDLDEAYGGADIKEEIAELHAAPPAAGEKGAEA